MNRCRILVITVVALGHALAVGATDQLSCNGPGTVYQLTPGISPTEITLMWQKASTDCDMLVDDGASTGLAIGWGVEPRFERIALGALPGVPIRLTIRKVSGPNSRAWVRIADSTALNSEYLPTSANLGLRYLGTAKELAEKDPEYAKLLQTWRRAKGERPASRDD